MTQASDTAVPVTGHPPVHSLPGHPEPLGNLSDRDVSSIYRDRTNAL